MEKISISKYVWAGFLAIIGFLMYKILTPFFLDPIKEFTQWKGRIAQTLIEHGRAFGPFAKEEDNQVSRKLFRELRGEGDRIVSQIPWYGIFSWFGVLPDRDSLEKALGNLLGLSNCGIDEMSGRLSARCEEKLRDALHLGRY